MIKKCVKCYETFECHADENCWCFSIKNSKGKLGSLAYLKEDCLCQKCLQSINS